MPEPRFTRTNHGKGHSYTLDGHRLPGVTTIINTLDKPALLNWAATETARYAIDHWERLTGITTINRFEELKNARFTKTKEAQVTGKRIHSLGERLAKGEEVEVPPELRGPVQAYADLLDAWDFQAMALEAPCVNLDYRYAGTFDAILTSPKTGPLMVDIKTGKRAYSDVALQLAAYRYTDLFLEEVEQFGPRGGRRPSVWVERDMPEVAGAAVIHIERDTDESPAAASLLPVQAGEAEWSTFLHLQEIYETWIKRTDYRHKDGPDWAPPIGEALYPEMNPDEILEAITS